MSTCGRLIAEGKRLILVDAKDPSMVPYLLDCLRDEFGDGSVMVYDDASDLCSAVITPVVFQHVGLRVLFLWDLTEDSLGLLESLDGMCRDDAVVLVQRRSIPKSGAYTRLVSMCETLALETPDVKACESYVSSMLKGAGCRFTDDVPSLLVSEIGRNLPSLAMAVKKISLLGRDADGGVVRRLVRGGGDFAIFNLVDAVLRKRWRQSLVMASSVPEGDLVGFLHAMQSQCLKLYKAADLRKQGIDRDSVATMLDVPPYVAKMKIIPLAEHLGRGGALRMLDAVHAADERARISRLPKRVLFESLVVYLLKS